MWCFFCENDHCFFPEQQNVVAVQYQGQIFYRVCTPIAPNEEFLTYYGDLYFYEMGGDPKTFHATSDPDHVGDNVVSYFFNTEFANNNLRFWLLIGITNLITESD